MANNIKFTGILPLILLITIIITGCAEISQGKPINNSQDTAILYIQTGLTLVSFDGQKINRAPSGVSKAASVSVPSGTYIMEFDYKVESGNTTTTAKGFEITANFVSGNYYLVNWERIPPNTIRIYIRETTEGVYRSPSE